MQTFNSLANKARSNAAVTVVACAHAGVFLNHALGERHFAKQGSAIAFSYPSVFAVSGSNPHPGGATHVDDLQRPFGVEFKDVAILDGSAADWIYDGQTGLTQNELGANPDQDGCGCDCGCKNEVKNRVSSLDLIKNGLNHIQSVEKQRSDAPNQVGFWAVDNVAIHASIFSGEALDRKKDSK